MLSFWICSKTKRNILLSKDSVDIVSSLIESIYGGFLHKETVITYNDNVIFSKFDHVVVGGHLCSLLKELGTGAYGVVYKGYDYRNNIYIAVKKQSIKNRDIICKQMEITRYNGIGLANTNINIGPTFCRDGYGYFLIPLADMNYLQWVQGKLLHKDYKSILNSLLEISIELKLLHEKKLVHMDLKLDNILVISNKCYLSDFGKAEKSNNVIFSAPVNYLDYPHCDPNYFSTYSSKSYYVVSNKFDLYSLGKIIKDVSYQIKDKKLALDLFKIGSKIHIDDSSKRLSLDQIIYCLRIRLSKL